MKRPPYFFKRLLLILVLLTVTMVTKAQRDSIFLKVDNYRGNIQWEESNNQANWSPVTAGNVNALKVSPDKTTYYRARVTELGCTPIYSNTKAVYANGSLVVGAKIISGKLSLPVGTSVNLANLYVRSLFDSAKVNNDSSFSLLVADSVSTEILLVTGAQNKVILAGYFPGIQTDYQLSAQSTAMTLVMIYPFLKPVEYTRARELMNAYAAENEYKLLVQQVETGIKQNADIFSGDDPLINQYMVSLINKPYNKPRLRIADADPVEMFTAGTVVTLRNNTSHVYVGAIYHIPDGVKLKSFQLAGSLLAEDKLLQFRPGYNILNDPDDLKTEQPFDLGALSNMTGKYEIRLRSGLAGDETAEDNRAYVENFYELAASYLISLVPSAIPLEDECVKEMIESWINAAKAGYRTNPKTDFARDVAIPFFVDYTSIIKECTKNEFLDVIFRFAKNLDKINGVLPAFTFNAEWLIDRRTIDGCRVMDDQHRLINCFVFEPQNTLSRRTYTCGVQELKIVALEDERYYPYQGNPIPLLDFEWLTTKGNGGFLPSGVINEPGKTDGYGEASIQWKMPPAGVQVDNTASARYILNDGTVIAKSDFTTSSYDPKLNVLTAGDDQSSEPGSALPKPVILSINDQATTLTLMDIDQFEITPVLTGGGTLISDASVTTPKTKGWTWTLGSQPGEQTATFTITSKTCSWPVQGSPAVIKAHATNLPALTTANINSITANTATGGGNITTEGGSPVTQRGICWSLSHDPTITNSKTEEGAGTGSFSSSMTDLIASTTYYVRAYATNSDGTAYGNEVSFTTGNISLDGTTFALISWRFQPVPGYINTATCNNPPYLGFVGTKYLKFSATSYTVTITREDGTTDSAGPFNYSIGTYYTDSLFLATGPDCTTSYGHQYSEGWGMKAPPGYDLRFGEYAPTRLSLDGTKIYRLQSGDEVYIKQ